MRVLGKIRWIMMSYSAVKSYTAMPSQCIEADTAVVTTQNIIVFDHEECLTRAHQHIIAACFCLVWDRIVGQTALRHVHAGTDTDVDC